MTTVYTPATQPSSVTTAGVISAVAISAAAHKNARLTRVLVVQTSGAAASYEVTVTTDSVATDLTKRVAKFTGNTASVPCDYDNNGRGYVWANNDGSSNLYVQVIPNTGTNNAYTIRLFFEDTFSR